MTIRTSYLIKIISYFVTDTQVLNNENCAKGDDYDYNNESSDDDDDDDYGKASLFCDTIVERK